MKITTLGLSRPTRTFDGGYILYRPDRSLACAELLQFGQYEENGLWQKCYEPRPKFDPSRFSWPRVFKMVNMAAFGFEGYYQKDPSYYRFSDALQVLTHLGLEPPTLEDALLFGWQHPSPQLDNSIMFPHERWYGTGFKDYDGLITELDRFVRNDGSKGRKITMTDSHDFYVHQLFVGVVSERIKPSSQPFELPKRRVITFDL